MENDLFIGDEMFYLILYFINIIQYLDLSVIIRYFAQQIEEINTSQWRLWRDR